MVAISMISCGMGEATITAIMEDPDEPVPAPLKATFMIVPPAPQITETAVEDHAVRVVFDDFWEIGAAGYDVEYRRTGDVYWTIEKAAQGASSHTISGLDDGASYEIRVRAWVIGPNVLLKTDMPYYGEYGDIVTVEVR